MRASLRVIARRLVPSQGLAERTIKSGIWATVTNIGDRLLQIVLLVVLARLLDPADFGLMGIALLTVNGLKKLSELGIDAALIHQQEDNIDRYLNTAWCLQILRGLLLAGITFLSAPYVASFFGEPRAAGVLQVISIAPLLLDLRNPGIVYFQKSLEFHKEFIYKMSGSVAYFCVALTYALVRPTVWALVFGYIASDAVRFIISYFLHEHRPWPEFDLSSARELISYGKWITGNSIVVFLFLQGDDAVVGWLLGATALGFYQLSYRLSNAPATEVTSVVSSVVFPAYAQLQNDDDKLRQAFVKTFKVITLISFPAAIGISVVTPAFIQVFLGDDWTPMTTVMQILAIWGLLRAFAATSSPLWKAIGRPDYVMKLGTIKIALLAVLFYPATTQYGIEGTALVLVGTYVFVQWPIGVHLTVKPIGMTYTHYLRILAYPLAASIAMGLIIVLAQRSLDVQPTVEFFLSIIIGVVSYVLAVVALEAVFEWGITRDIKDAVSTASS